MSPENQWLECAFPIEIGPFFRGHALVFGGVLYHRRAVSNVAFFSKSKSSRNLGFLGLRPTAQKGGKGVRVEQVEVTARKTST